MSALFVNIYIIAYLLSHTRIVSSTNNVCVSHNDFVPLDGTYQYVSYNESINSAIYHCQKCGWNNAPVFLYGFRYKYDENLFENFWIIGPDPKAQGAWSYCEIGFKTADYIFNITDCKHWVTYSNNALIADDITAQPCRNTTQNKAVSYVPHQYPAIVFGFKTPSSIQSFGSSDATITMTLYWNYMKYQCNVLPFKSDTMYLCDTSEIDTSVCNDSSSTIAYGLQIDNDHSDAVEVDQIIIKHIYNQSVQTDIMFDYFCANTSQSNTYTPRIHGRCVDALHGGYDIFAIDTDDTNAPFHLFLFDESVLFNDVNESRFGLESYVVPQPIASSCTDDATDQRYELIARLKNSRLGTFSAAIKTDGNENVDHMDANTYSIIGTISNIIRESPQLYQNTNGKYQFKLIYENADGTRDVIDFKQSSWIQSASVEGYEAIDVPLQNNIPSECDAFKGLAISERNETYIDGSNDSKCWWSSIGTISRYTDYNGYTGIPGFNSKIAYSSALYLLKPLSNDIETTTAMPFTTAVNHAAHDIIIAYQERTRPIHDTTVALHEKEQELPHTPTAPASTVLIDNQLNDDWDIFNVEEASTLHIIVGACIVFVCCSIPLLVGILIGCCCYHRNQKTNDGKQSGSSPTSTPKEENDDGGEIQIKIDREDLNVNQQKQKVHAEGYEGEVHKMSLFSQDSELSDGMYENVAGPMATPQTKYVK